MHKGTCSSDLLQTRAKVFSLIWIKDPSKLEGLCMHYDGGTDQLTYSQRSNASMNNDLYYFFFNMAMAYKQNKKHMQHPKPKMSKTTKKMKQHKYETLY